MRKINKNKLFVLLNILNIMNYNIAHNNIQHKKYDETHTYICEKTQNEINISEKIMKIPNYSIFFSPILKYKILKYAKLNDNFYEEDSKKREKYVLLYKKHHKYEDLIAFFSQISEPGIYIKHLIQSYSYLLDSLKLLNKNKLCYFDLKFEKLCFDEKNNPILCDFEECIDYSNCDCQGETESIQMLNNYIGKYYIFPLEAHVLMYLNEDENKNKRLSQPIIEEICKNYIVKNLALLVYNKENIKLYYKKCVKYLLMLNLENENENNTKKLYSHIHTWDTYSLSIMYLQILLKFSKTFNLDFERNKFLNFFSTHLLKFIEPDPKERLDINSAINEFKSIYQKDLIDWTFIKELKREKVFELNESLIKNMNYISDLLY